MPTTWVSESEPLLRVISPVPYEDEDDYVWRPDARAEDAGGEPLGSPEFLFKVSATLLSFLVLGLIVSTPGVILPHLEAHYHLNDVQASLIFLVAPAGYLLGARLNVPIHRRLGQRGIAMVAPVCQIVFTGTAATFHNPRQGGFPLFLVATAVGNIGSGLLDGSWCAWAGGLGGKRTNTVQGLLHGSFSVGAGLGPLVSGTMFSVSRTPWWMWYYVLLGAVVSQGVAMCLAFRLEDGRRYRATVGKSAGDHVEGATQPSAASKSIFRYAVLWMCAAYFLAYVGTEAAISGWVVTFMLRVRRASPYLASVSSTGFWIGMSAGRFVLGSVTDKFGVRRTTAVYLMVAILGQTLLAAIDMAAVSVGLVAAVGFFLGPIFPSGIVVIARLLPRDLHVGAVSFVCSVGQVGAALLPFILGSLAQWLGIRVVFQVFILATLAATLLTWFMFPALPQPGPRCHDARHDETAAQNETRLH